MVRVSGVVVRGQATALGGSTSPTAAQRVRANNVWNLPKATARLGSLLRELGAWAGMLTGAMVPALAIAAPATYVLDSTHTTPMFSVLHLGMSQQRGFFTNTLGRVVLDPEARRGSIDIEIGTGSIVTASRVLTEVLKRADYFNSDQFPTMRFTSRDLAFEGDVPVAANGELTLLGVTRPVRLAIANFKCGIHPYTRHAMCGAEVTTTIRRSQFGMTSGLPTAAGDEVRIVIPVEAMQE